MISKMVFVVTLVLVAVAISFFGGVVTGCIMSSWDFATVEQEVMSRGFAAKAQNKKTGEVKLIWRDPDGSWPGKKSVPKESSPKKGVTDK